MFLLIIEAVISSSTGVLLIACAGAWLMAFKVIDPKFTSQLSGVVERVLLPALIFTNFLSAITLAQVLDLLPCVIATFFCVGCGYCVGFYSNRYWIKEPDLTQIILLSSANPHTTNIPLSLSYSLNALFAKLMKLPERQTEEYLVTVIMIQTVIINSMRWSLGKSIMLKYDAEIKAKDIELGTLGENKQNDSNNLKQSILSQTQQVIGKKPGEESHKESCWNAPLYAVMAALICLLVAPVQRLLLGDNFFHSAIFVPLNILGKASPPSVLLILGSNLYLIYSKGRNSKVATKTLWMITLNRLLILPFLGLAVLYLVRETGLVLNECHCFVLFILFCTPSAINILVMSKQYTDNTEEIVSMILLYGYLACIITLPFWMIVYFNLMF